MSRVLDMWSGMTGVVFDFAGTEAPPGWMMCFGQSISRSDYQNLFLVIGTTYGAEDGEHFNIPDARGRVMVGKDDMGGSSAGRLTMAGAGVDGTTLGASGGAETHGLTAAQMPAHTHPNTLSDPGHSHANSITDPGHSHSFASGTAWTNGGPQTWGGGSAGYIGVQAMNSAATGIAINNASSGTGATISNESSGGGENHPNVQPSMILNKIIRI